jgi:hypothetical protein
MREHFKSDAELFTHKAAGIFDELITGNEFEIFHTVVIHPLFLGLCAVAQAAIGCGNLKIQMFAGTRATAANPCAVNDFKNASSPRAHDIPKNRQQKIIEKCARRFLTGRH